MVLYCRHALFQSADQKNVPVEDQTKLSKNIIFPRKEITPGVMYKRYAEKESGFK